MEFNFWNQSIVAATRSNQWQMETYAKRPILGRQFKPTPNHYGNINSTQRPNNAHWTTWTEEYCVFCCKNGEAREFCDSHRVKDRETGCVTCPVLRSYVCPTCNATGDNAHTASYCPKRHVGRAVTTSLKTTPRNSTGLRMTPRYLNPPHRSYVK